ncbi:hypothetical protein [Pseudomonas nicosulfuronedens]
MLRKSGDSSFSITHLLLWVLLYGAVAALIMLSSRGLIGAVNVEIGDFAANSLLIQDAKTFDLLVGNYSRVGFNHPGPAILYVLAAGEWLFHDVLHWVPSPFSGQLVAIALYNAFWILQMLLLFRRFSLPASLACLGLATFAVVAAFENHSFFSGAWFPELYFFPFAVALLALARLGSGAGDSLGLLGLSTGFLVNGHASFAALLGVMLVVVLLGNFLLESGPRRVATLGFLKLNRWWLLFGVVVLLLFFVPLLILTVRNFPGPLGEYASFGGTHKANRFKDATNFALYYWGGLPAGLMALILSLVLWRYEGAGELRTRFVRPVLLVSLAATIALLLYAMFGIDILGFPYIGYFYFAVPALVAGTGAVVLLSVLRGTGRVAVSAVLSVLLVWGCFAHIKKPPGYASHYQAAQIVELYNALAALKSGSGRMVLDLDNSGDWGEVWLKVLGVGAYAKRQGNDLFCINRNWHISFTRAALCHESELDAPHFVVRNSNLTDPREPLASFAGMSVYGAQVVDSLPARYLSVADNRTLFAESLLGRGWSTVENEFAWSEGRVASVSVPVPRGFSGKLELDLGAFLPKSDSTQKASFRVEGGASTEAVFSARQSRQRVSVSLNNWQGASVQLAIAIENPKSPLSVGMSSDSRALGLSIYGIELVPGA